VKRMKQQLQRRSVQNEELGKILESLIGALNPRGLSPSERIADEVVTVMRALVLGAKTGAGDALGASILTLTCYELSKAIGEAIGS
jgi:hypothetical protein